MDNTDIFKMMKNHFEMDTFPPAIFIISLVENHLYNSSNIWLNVSLNETASWLAYSFTS